jgi:putative membrane protein
MKLIYILLVLLAATFFWSAIKPHDYFTWFLEVLPAIVGIAVLASTFSKFRFTNLVYTLIFIHCVILIIGGHYTYAEVPLFDWIQEIFNQSRNNYDKLGHFAQGFVPAMITRELLIRKNVILKNNWLNFITVAMALAISASYEFIEWGVSLLTGEGGDSFLGTQGYIWDTQSDMLFATIGAIIALISLSKNHNNQLKVIKI